MRGGARTRSGPPTDPAALRRDRKDDAAEWLELPAEGRPGRPPAWPLPTKATAPERRLWAREWTRPQAIEWERLGCEIEVALYCRSVIEAERPGAPTNARTLAKQLADNLGITIPGMRAHRWRIAAESAASAPRTRRASSSSTAKARLEVIAGGG